MFGDTVTATVKEGNEYVLHRNLIHHSGHFAKGLSLAGADGKPAIHTIELREVSNVVFRSFVSWLYSGELFDSRDIILQRAREQQPKRYRSTFHVLRDRNQSSQSMSRSNSKT